MNMLFTGTLDPPFKQAATQRQSLFIGSGDTGATTLELDSSYQLTLSSTPAVSEMPADPYVTAAGGTQYDPTYQNNQDLGFAEESAWNYRARSTGGGYSALFPNRHGRSITTGEDTTSPGHIRRRLSVEPRFLLWCGQRF
jgi:subtilase family serine protease